MRKLTKQQLMKDAENNIKALKGELENMGIKDTYANTLLQLIQNDIYLANDSDALKRYKEIVEPKKTAEMDVTKLRDANESLKGTSDSHKYYMETYAKVDKKWIFIGWSYVLYNVYLKKHGKNIYLQSMDNEYKYKVSDAVKELLGL